MYNPALFACALLLLLPTSNVIAQTTDSTDVLPVRRDSCAPRGNLSMLVTTYINIADLEELNAVLAENGYPEFDEVVGGPLHSTGIDMLVHGGLRSIDVSGSYRLLTGKVNTVHGSADYRGMYFSFGMGSSIPIARRLRISLGCVWEFSIIEAQLQSGGFDSIPWNTDFDSAIRNGQQDDRLRMLSSFQIAFAPAVNVHWRAFTWKVEEGPVFSLDLALKAQYNINIPINPRVEVNGVYVNAPSFNFSQVPVGIGIGWGMEL